MTLLYFRASVICCVNPSQGMMIKEITSSAESLITSNFLEEISDVLKDSDIDLQSFRLECLNQSLSLAMLERPPNYKAPTKLCSNKESIACHSIDPNRAYLSQTIARLIRKQFEVAPDSAIETYKRILPQNNQAMLQLGYPENEREYLCWCAYQKAKMFSIIHDSAALSKWYKTTIDLVKYCPNLTAHLPAIKREQQMHAEKANI
jgi:hypothetical protein